MLKLLFQDSPLSKISSKPNVLNGRSCFFVVVFFYFTNLNSDVLQTVNETFTCTEFTDEFGFLGYEHGG